MTLSHHGIMGQKWGIRRYQNSDGSLTAEGKRRYGENGEVLTAIKKGGRFGVVGAVAAGLKAKYDLNKGTSSKLKPHKYTLKEKMEINAAMRKKAKQQKSPEYQKEKQKQEEENRKFRQMNTKQKVDYAKKTGKFDMEFLESNGDIDDRTGNSLQGERLYKAYEKYLKERYGE